MSPAGAMQVTVNGREVSLPEDPGRRLIDALRDDLGLTGTKEGCGIGVCGLCSVIVDGKLLSACLLPLVALESAEVVTIEGIGGEGGQLTPLQQAFISEGGFQCGICTPGQIVAATALLAEVPDPSDELVGTWMKGNLCRCTGYEGIRSAIRAAATAGDR